MAWIFRSAPHFAATRGYPETFGQPHAEAVDKRRLGFFGSDDAADADHATRRIGK